MNRATGLTLCLGLLVVAGCTSSSDSPTVSAPPPSNSASTSASTPAAPATIATGSAPAAFWPSYHGDQQRSGYAASMPAASGRLSAQLITLDGQVYASPLVLGNTVVVATEHNDIYGLDLSGKVRWHHNFGTPTPASALPCGNIEPIGITGTPAYDQQTDTVFAVASTGSAVLQTLIGLNPNSGQVSFSRRIEFPGVDPNAMQQRGALAVAGGRVWIPFGARAGDCGNYRGRLVGISTSGTGSQVYYSPPTKRGGGIWNPMGVVVNPAGHLLVVSANGAAFPGDPYDHTNSLLELNGATLLDSFAPQDWAQNNQGDVGLGSQSPALVGDRWIFLGGKSMDSYVLRQDRLGGIGGQVSTAQFCRSFGGTAVVGDTVFVPCTDGVRAVRISADGRAEVGWHAPSSVAGSPVVGGGRVYALDQTAGALVALDQASGKVAERVSVGPVSRFGTPAIGGSRLYVPTLSGIAVVSTS